MTDKEALEHLIRLGDGGTNHSHDSNEACRIGAEALRERMEREERSKGCEYCVGFTDQQRQDFSMPNNTKKDCDIVKINFCPMCGRPLKTAMQEEEV